VLDAASLPPIPGTVPAPFGNVKIQGYLDLQPDVDLAPRPAVIANVAPGTPVLSAFGTGEVRLLGALATSVTFNYGIHGDVHGADRGGFTGYTFSRSNDETGAPRDATSYYKQFAVLEGYPAGPVTPPLTAPTVDTKYFNGIRWTSGTAGANVTTINRPGVAQVADVTFQYENAMDIVRNKDSLKVLPPSGATIDAVFEPHGAAGPVDVRDLAVALGVDHFNWKQKVIGVPGSWLTAPNRFVRLLNTSLNIDKFSPTPKLLDGTPVSFVEPFTVPILDPLTEPHDYVALRVGGEWYVAEHGAVDTLPYYYNETDVSPGDKWDSMLWINQSTKMVVMGFEDKPTMGERFYGQNEFLEFQTELVGVRDDSTELPLGIGFRWKSNAVNAEKRYIFASFTYTNPPPAVSGSVFDVEVFGLVPEPMALALSVIGVMSLALTRYRRRSGI
jgi:hypothetical protein